MAYEEVSEVFSARWNFVIRSLFSLCFNFKLCSMYIHRDSKFGNWIRILKVGLNKDPVKIWIHNSACVTQAEAKKTGHGTTTMLWTIFRTWRTCSTRCGRGSDEERSRPTSPPSTVLYTLYYHHWAHEDYIQQPQTKQKLLYYTCILYIIIFSLQNYKL